MERKGSVIGSILVFQLYDILLPHITSLTGHTILRLQKEVPWMVGMITLKVSAYLHTVICESRTHKEPERNIGKYVVRGSVTA